jgi:hypothetical protein
MVRLSGRCRQNVTPQLGLFEPPRDRAFEDPRPARAKSSSGDDEDAPATRFTTHSDKAGELPMRLGLGHSVQIKARLNFVQTAL